MKNDSPALHVKREIKLGRNLKATVLRWHRNIGIMLAAFILLFALSGISLNHTESLSLDDKFVEANWLLDLYGIETPNEIRYYQDASVWVAQVGHRTFTSYSELTSDAGKLLGFVQLDELKVIAFEQEIVLMDMQGEVIDRLSAESGLPGKLNAIAKSGRQVWIQSNEGMFFTDHDFLEWSAVENNGIAWVTAFDITPDIKQKLVLLYRGKGLSYERILLDMHSGRVFGQWGVWLMDAAALALIVMSLSGVWLWLKVYRKTAAQVK